LYSTVRGDVGQEENASANIDKNIFMQCLQNC
jgi:hypothetical protein